MSQHEVVIRVNGEAVADRVPARLTLVDFLRERCRLTGTHVGCEHGICGACTVELDGRPVRSCLMFAVQADGHDVNTVEGLADKTGRLSVLQDAFCETHATQCGFCTPGMLMAARSLLTATLDPSDDQIREALSGNLCRCTGYVQILEGVRLAAKRLRDLRAAAATTAGETEAARV